jgi:hypothetical protein
MNTIESLLEECMTDKTREAFEAWHDKLFDLSAKTAVKSEYGYPQNGNIQMRWQAWQASRADFLSELRSDEMVEVVATEARRQIEDGSVLYRGIHEPPRISAQGWAKDIMIDCECLAKAALVAIVKELGEDKPNDK